MAAPRAGGWPRAGWGTPGAGAGGGGRTRPGCPRPAARPGRRRAGAELRAEDRRAGFSLADGPLLRVALIRLSDTAVRMVWTFHHVLLDGWSVFQVLDDVAAAYAALAAGTRWQPPARPPFGEYLRWLAGRPEVARGLLLQLASRLRKVSDVVADLVFSDVPGRVAKALLDLASRFGRTADDGVHVHHDLTQEELAQLVGASRETVNKALADFASRGWLRLEPRSVVIMDIDRLRRRAR